MKKTLFIISLMVVTGCKSGTVNLSFRLLGIYDDKAKIERLNNENHEVVFIPMHHLGTKLFYEDINKKVDSLENLGYHFYTEMVNGNANDTLAIMKIRKITGVPISKKNEGYVEIFDSINDGKIKYKKELINQPSYKNLGVDSLNGRNVDVTINQMIQYYEYKYGEIKLEKCDYEKTVDKKTNCKSKPVNRKFASDVMVNFRNQNVIDELQKDNHTKIAIIYGANHFVGIKKELLKLGYK